MALSLDPSIRRLDDCGCCDGVTAETPAPTANRPGLDAIDYRVGTHATFKATMLAAVSASPTAALRALQTRDDDDFTVAILDAWALSLDVLTFYQERIVNESYLRTATERLSVAELARLIGYQPRPGIAANTHLAFTLETATGAPGEVTLAPGLRVQSVPGPDEQPQTFETVESIVARPAWNAMPARRTEPQALSATMATLWLGGADPNLKTGEQLLIVANNQWAMRRIAAVARDDEAGRTRIDLEPVDMGPSPVTAPDGVFALRARAAPFGHNAPLMPPPATPADLAKATEWDLDEPDARELSLDAVYDQLRPGGLLVVERNWLDMGWIVAIPIGIGLSLGSGPLVTPDARTRLLRGVEEVRVTSRASYGLTGRVTHVRLDEDWLDGFESSLARIRDVAIYLRNEPLAPGESPILGILPANAIELTGDFGDLPVGRAVVVSGKALGAGKDAPVLRELATIASVAVKAGITTLTLAQDLVIAFDRQTVTVNANVARATHGETVSEVLGSGDARQPYQRFTLRGGPLTYLPATNAIGAAPALEVRVNDLLWRETPTLYGESPNSRVYVVRQGDDSRTTIQFGDGVTGARLPSGNEQVRARYRKGLGKAGNVNAGQLSLLLTRPLGVKEVSNPVPAEGGGEPESRARARQNAPLTVVTLDRVVSLRDYEDFAHAYTGIAKALATWTWDGQRQGIVLTIAGDDGADVSETGETYPRLVAALRALGDPRVPLRVRPFSSVGFRVTAQVTKSSDVEVAAVETTVGKTLLTEFSFEERQFGQSVALSHVMAVIQGVAGVVGVDVTALHRLDLVGGGGRQSRLPAFAPRPGAAFTTEPAELLTLAESGIDLVVT